MRQLPYGRDKEELMVNLMLKKQAVREMHFVLNLTEDSRIEMENTLNFSVDYMDNNQRCVAKFRQIAKEKAFTPRLSIEVEMRGFFVCEGIFTDDDKRQAHVQAYDALFPYMQAIFSQITMNAGLPAMMLEKVRLDPRSVNVPSAPPAQNNNNLC